MAPRIFPPNFFPVWAGRAAEIIFDWLHQLSPFSSNFLLCLGHFCFQSNQVYFHQNIFIKHIYRRTFEDKPNSTNMNTDHHRIVAIVVGSKKKVELYSLQHQGGKWYLLCIIFIFCFCTNFYMFGFVLLSVYLYMYISNCNYKRLNWISFESISGKVISVLHGEDRIVQCSLFQILQCSLLSTKRNFLHCTALWCIKLLAVYFWWNVISSSVLQSIEIKCSNM